MQVAKARKLRAYVAYQKLEMTFLEAEHDYLVENLAQTEAEAEALNEG
jgi:hypothetical protein